MQLRVTVLLLNKRSRIPVYLPDPKWIVGQVKIGYTFEGFAVDDLVVPNPALGKWYVDRDGYYYWGGGLSEVEEIVIVPTVEIESDEFSSRDLSPANLESKGLGGVEIDPGIQFDPEKMSWGHKYYDIPALWKNLGTKGEGVTVAVIDTGIDTQHIDLIPNIHSLSKNFVGQESDFADVAGHGTNMAGIIAAAGNKVYGIAPQAKLLIVKATAQLNGVDLKVFAHAIEYAASIPEVDIVSISYAFLIDDVDLKGAIQKCLDAKKIVVSAVGNRRNTTKPMDNDTFPSSYNNGFPENEGVLAIGAFDKNGKLCSFSNWNNHISMLSPGDLNILTTGMGNTTANGSMTSIATAFTSGCLALMIAYLKLKNPTLISTCGKILLSTCDDIGATIGYDIQSGYGCMNLRNAIAKIK